MQGTRLLSLVQEDYMCCLWATTTEGPRAWALQQEKPLQWEACTPKLEKAHMQQWRPSVAKNKFLKIYKRVQTNSKRELKEKPT